MPTSSRCYWGLGPSSYCSSTWPQPHRGIIGHNRARHPHIKGPWAQTNGPWAQGPWRAEGSPSHGPGAQAFKPWAHGCGVPIGVVLLLSHQGVMFLFCYCGGRCISSMDNDSRSLETVGVPQTELEPGQTSWPGWHIEETNSPRQ